MAHPSLLKTEVWGSTGKSLPIIDHIAGAGRDPYQSWHSGDKSCLWITLQPPPEELAFLPGGEVVAGGGWSLLSSTQCLSATLHIVSHLIQSYY